MDLRVLKPLGRATAIVEIWDRHLLIVEVFAGQDGTRRFHFAEEAAGWGPHWNILSRLAPQVFKLLDVADKEMRQAREKLSQ